MSTQYRVWLSSVPGPYAQYSGKVDVVADDEYEAVDRAFRQLRRGAFPDRDRACWLVDNVEEVAE